MVSTGTKLDRKTLVEEQSLEIIRRLLNELGGSRGLAALAARGAHAHLERELGLGSLERVELMLRLGDACGVRLPDSVVADADSVQDLIDALLRAPEGENGAGTGAAGAAAAPALASPAPRPDLERQIRSSETLTEIFWLRGRAEPARAHIQLYEESGKLRTITFGELYARASAVASELLRRGLEPGQTVAIMLPTCAEFFFTFAGILLAGGIPVPIYPPFRADRIAEYAARQANILRNAESRFLITWRQAESLARLLRPRVPTLREVLNAGRLASAAPEPESSPKAWRPVETITPHARSSDIAFLQYTSGSTGDPKGVILTHANLLSNIHSIIAGIEVRPEDSCVSWLPLYHDMGLIGAWFVPLFTGIPLIVMSPLAFLSRPERWLWAIHRHRATISPAPNFAYELCVRKIADKDLAGLDLGSWRAATNGAEPVHPETLARFAARFAPYGFRRESLAPVYGLAEATLAVSAPKMGAGYKVDRIQRAALESDGLAIPAAADADDSSTLEFVGAGKPVPGVEVRLVPLEHAQADVSASGALENGSRQGTASQSAETAFDRHSERSEESLFLRTPAEMRDFSPSAERSAEFDPRQGTALAVPKNAPPSGVSTPEANREPVALGERIEGRLWFRGPSATSGYYRNPRATAELIHEGGWLDSGDLAYWADGELYITGRAKDVIIKAGRNIYPHEVEIIAGKIPGVRTGCVVAFGAPDKRTGTERLIIAAELRDPSAAARISDEITRAIDDALGMPPDVIELLAPQSIPKTSSGKLRRSETRRLYLEGKLGRKVQPAWVQIAKLAADGAPTRAWSAAARMLRRAIEIVYGVYALAAFSAVLVPLWAAVALAPDRHKAARLARRGARWMLLAAGVPVRVENPESLREIDRTGPWIFAPNHASYLDTLVTLAFLPAGVRFVAKGEALEMPLVGAIIRRSGQFAFDRSDPQARIRQSEEVNDALRAGESVVIYPEGTFTPAVGIRPFQLGAFKAAVDTQRPICPVAMRGARQILRDQTTLPRPGRVTVVFGPLVAPDPSAGTAWPEIVRLRDATRSIISHNSAEPLL